MVSIDVIIPVYKYHEYLPKVLHSIETQLVEKDISCSCIVVSDGYSGSDLIDLMNKYPDYYLVSLDENLGRSTARNTGAKYSKGDYLFFLDDDCVLTNPNIINQHCQLLKNGYDASFGSIQLTPKPNGFWEDYIYQIAKKRSEAAKKNDFISLTSANMAIKRCVFEKVGCFDSSYRCYGFEDRDLIANIVLDGYKIKYSDELMVFHDENIRLVDITRKMKDSAQYSANTFCGNHPILYKQMVYYYIDARFHPYFLFIPFLISLLLTDYVVKLLDKLLLSNLIPRKMGFLIVKLVSALSYVNGSYRSKIMKNN